MSKTNEEQLIKKRYDLEDFRKRKIPLGISFYTFQSMSYVIDVYRGDAKVVNNFIDYACYVSMFPQLVAGPIIRFQDVADQLRKRTLTWEKFARGTSFFMLGMAKRKSSLHPPAAKSVCVQKSQYWPRTILIQS